MRPALPRLALLAALLLPCAWAPPAAAQPPLFEIAEIVPGTPTWQDEVKIVIQGNFQAIPEVVGIRVTPGVVTVELVDDYVRAAPPYPPGWLVTAEAGRLAPGNYQVVVDPDRGDSFEAGEFTVFDRAPIAIETPGEAYSDDEPVVFHLILFEDNLFDVEVEARPELGIVDVSVDRDGTSYILPTAYSALSVPVGAGLLPAGDYEIRVIDVSNDFGYFSAVTRGVTVYRADGCVPSATELCLGEGRFRVEVTWRDFRDRRGDGVAVPLEGRDDTGSFWFFNENNLELTVKVLDGCGVNGHHWVFVSSGSTVEYEITVTDTEAEEGLDRVRTYRNSLGQTPALIPDTAAFPNCP